jgi:nitrite reductase/ring-hydroxylating ferredoxin subunit
MEIRAAALDDVPPGRPTLVEVEGLQVVLTRVGDSVYACGNVCAHRGGSLHDGRLTGVKLACSVHGWMYDVRTGQCVFPPGRGASVPTYRVRVDDGSVFVEVP